MSKNQHHPGIAWTCSIWVLLFGLLSVGAARAQSACDPDSYFSDPALLGAEVVQDFQNLPPEVESEHYYETSPLELDGISYWSEGGAAISNGLCIPGLDSNYDGCGCGGENKYLAYLVTGIHLEYSTPADKVGFRYGAQSSTMEVYVTLSDGSQKHFVLDTPSGCSWGTTGFFGYCTGDPTLKVVRVDLYGGDGGVDDIRCEGCGVAPCEDGDGDGWTTCGDDEAAPDCDDTDPSVHPGADEIPYDGIDQDCNGIDLVDVDGDGYPGGADGPDCDDTDATIHPDASEVCDGMDNDCDGEVDTVDGMEVCQGSCTLDSLTELVLGIEMPERVETSLMIKVRAAQVAVARGRIEVAIRLLEALQREVMVFTGRGIDVDDAHLLVACSGEVIATLSGLR